ncbi:MAG: rod shape-determining protein MreD [Spirochaetota bacterium]|nr:rod shape-determining protein MreD [Spirochaetota bacterium]
MITTYIFSGALLIASLIIQGHSSFDVLRVVGVKPDLIFIVIIYLAYNFGSFFGEITGFIGGLLHDAVSNSPLGLLAFPKMIIAFFIGMFGRTILKDNILTISLMILTTSILKGIITLILCYIFHEGRISTVVAVILPESLYNAVIAPLLFYLFDKIFQENLSKEGN